MDKPIQKAISMYVAERKRSMRDAEACGVEITKRKRLIAANLVQNEQLAGEIETLQNDFLICKENVAKLSGKIEAVEEFGKGI